MKRRWLLYILILILLLFIASRFVQIESVIATLATAQPAWLLAAALLVAGFYVVNAILYQAGFSTVELGSKLSELIPVLFASVFVNTVAPTGGLSIMALFVDDARRRGQPPGRASEGALLVEVATLAGLAPLVLYALFYLAGEQDLETFEVVGAGIFMALILLFAVVLTSGLWWPWGLRAVLQVIQRLTGWLAQRLHRRPWLGADWAASYARDFAGAASAIGHHPWRLARTLGVAVLMQLLSACALAALFAAFRQPVDAGALLAGFALGAALGILSFIPYDLGAIEGIMTFVFVTLGVPIATALVIVLAFRALTAGVPLVIGFLLLRRVRTFGGHP